MSEIIELISDNSIDTVTEIGDVNLTQTDPLLCGFINLTKEEISSSDEDLSIKLILSACMFMKQFSPYNLRLFETDAVDQDIITFVRIYVKEPTYFVCRINLKNGSLLEITEKINIAFKKYNITATIIYDEQNMLIVG
jgi:hypothetical protein